MLLLQSATLRSVLPAAYEAFRRVLETSGVAFGASETAINAPEPDAKRYIEFGPADDGSMPAALVELRAHLALLVDEYAGQLHSAFLPQAEGPLIEMIERRRSPVLRMSWYPGGRSGTVNHPHADIDLFTLLPAATASGLEVLGEAGWTKVSPQPCEVLVLPGEMAQHLGGGPPAVHRVVIDGGERMSASLFVNAREELMTPSGISVAEVFAARLAAVRGTPEARGQRG